MNEMNDKDQRPPVWIGHVTLETSKIEQLDEFMQLVGMRSIAKGDDYSVLELRGGTHLVLIAKEDVHQAEAPFDLMVDDLEAYHQKLLDAGLTPTAIVPGDIHSAFEVTEPTGYTFKFNSSHVGRLPV